MKVEVAEEIEIGGIVIRPFYGPRLFGMRSMSFTTFSTYAYLIPILTRARLL